MNKKILSFILGILLVGYFGFAFLIRPNSWNTVYYELDSKHPERNSYKNVGDSIDARAYYGYPLIPHTIFEIGSSEFKKYKRGDTVPIFQNRKIVGEINLSDGKMLWSKVESDSLAN